jgi:hypothetical protein
MARIRCTARKSVIPFFCLLAWRSVPCVARCQVSLASWRDCIVACTRSRSADARSRSSRTLPPSPQREVESERPPSPAPQPEMPPAPPQGILAAGGDPDEDGDGDDDDAGGSSSHDTELSEELELEGWIARPITRDATRGCHFHDALDTLLCQAFNRHLVYRVPLCSLPASSWAIPGPVGGYLLGAPSKR